jgi:hypothetical protein
MTRCHRSWQRNWIAVTRWQPKLVKKYSTTSCGVPYAGNEHAKLSSALTSASPAGTVITVRLASAVGSKTSNTGDHFNATIATPVESGGKVVLPKGAEVLGKVAQAVSQGRFKGGASLSLALESVTIDGDAYDIKTNSVARYQKGKGKRTAAMIGGGAGGGALIGGLAGGGKGALIGAVLGAGAGTAGAAYTGEKEIVLPAESTLSFKLAGPLTVKM